MPKFHFDSSATISQLSAAPTAGPCSACGAPRESSTRFCTSCGGPLEIPGIASGTGVVKLDSQAGVSQAPEPIGPVVAVECSGCGSVISLSEDQRSYTCPFCDSAFVAELPTKQTGRHRPEFILGFTITPEQAKELFFNWLGRNSWFRPGDLSRRAVTDKQRGIYLPFWHFAMLAQSRWSADIGEHWYKTEHYTVTNAKGRKERRTRQVLKVEWFPLSGAFERYWFGHLVPAASGINTSEAKAIGPYPLTALSRYRPYYLAGWMSQEYSVSGAQAEEQCRTEFEQRQSQEINRFLPGDTQKGLAIDTRIEMLESDLILLPVYVLSYRYRGKPYRFLVNGTNGKVVGQKPWSVGRIATVVIVIIAILVILAVAASMVSS